MIKIIRDVYNYFIGRKNEAQIHPSSENHDEILEEKTSNSGKDSFGESNSQKVKNNFGVEFLIIPEGGIIYYPVEINGFKSNENETFEPSEFALELYSTRYVSQNEWNTALGITSSERELY